MVISDRFETKEVSIALSGADPDETGEIDFDPATQSTRIFFVRVVRTAQSGTAFTVDSAELGLYNKDPTVSDFSNVIFRRQNKEPDADEILIHENDIVFGTVVFFSEDTTPSGKLYVRIQRAGGDGTSNETYKVVIDTIREW